MTQQLPDNITTLEGLAVFLNGAGRGKCIDLGGRHMRNVGGYAQEFGYRWTELPLPHWRLPFLADGTSICNGDLKLSPRVQLVCTGANMALHNITITGAGKPEEDERNSLLVNGGNLDLEGCRLSAVGVYAWDGASVRMSECNLAQGLHCVYAWGPGAVDVSGCRMAAAEGSIVCARDRASVTIKDCVLEDSKRGSGIWVGESATVTASQCSISGNAEYGVEASHAGSCVKLSQCKCRDNAKGEKDEWEGGSVQA